MAQHNVIETVIGAVVIAVAGFFLVFAYQSADVSKGVGGYTVKAAFTNIEGIKEGGDIRINGIKVGHVVSLELNPETFMAELVLQLDRDVELPRDTVAVIANESLLGGRYVEIEPGIETDMLAMDGSARIGNTQPPILLDDLIGRFVFSPSENAPSGSAEPSVTGVGGAPLAVAPPTPPAQPSVTVMQPLPPGDGMVLPEPIRTSP